MKSKKYTAQTACLVLGSLLFVGSSHARSVYLNGQDVSSARNQTLNKVNLKIDENGDVFVEAPHYQAHEEKTYTPLSTYTKTANAPVHKPVGSINNTPMGTPGNALPTTTIQAIDTPASKTPIENEGTKLQDKPGVKAGG